VARAAAENLTPILLELGGQNPALVDETANIKDAAKKIVWGAMAWGGQWCTSPGYAYVHESITEEFVAEAKAALIELFGQDPKSNSDYSRVISEREVTRLAGLIDPAKVVIGGRSDPEARYLDPTIVYPVSWDDPIMEDEVFGPILPILAYRSLDEAFGRIAATPIRWRPSFSAASRRRSIASSANCPSVAAQSTRSTSICSWRRCRSAASGQPA
jgi:aldehyde dehydrogenase (NAD+)